MKSEIAFVHMYYPQYKLFMYITELPDLTAFYCYAQYECSIILSMYF
jgi:hypothetical protein